MASYEMACKIVELLNSESPLGNGHRDCRRDLVDGLHPETWNCEEPEIAILKRKRLIEIKREVMKRYWAKMKKKEDQK